jgi:hypothetical protein
VKPKTESMKIREERAHSREMKRQRHEGAEALISLYNKVVILETESSVDESESLPVSFNEETKGN